MSFDTFLAEIGDRYQVMFSSREPRYDQVFAEIAMPVLLKLESGDARYHTVDHTLQVISVGQAILEGKQQDAGKQQNEGSVSPLDWLTTLVSLLFHDLGYVKGICPGDRPHAHQYSDGRGGYRYLSPKATGAALAECHVDRSQAYAATHLSQYPFLDISAVQENIEMTRFPVPDDSQYRDILSYGGLCRAADLIGQLSDPRYLQKLPDLFREFEETGTNQALGYETPTDLRINYPDFYQHVVYPLVQPSLRYLGLTAAGRKRIAQLYTNIRLAKPAQPRGDITRPHRRQLSSEVGLIPWRSLRFTFAH